MKLVCVLLLILVPHRPQIEPGQTCLFECLHFLRPSRSVDQYIQDFHKFTGSSQDVYSDGARATVAQTIAFIKSEADTVDGQFSIVGALQANYRIITDMPTDGELDHSIVLVGLKMSGSDALNPFKIDLRYYDPGYNKVRSMNMYQWLRTNPKYWIIVKAAISFASA